MSCCAPRSVVHTVACFSIVISPELSRSHIGATNLVGSMLETSLDPFSGHEGFMTKS